MTLRRPEETFVHDDTELFDLWCALMGPGGFARRSLWMIFVHADGNLAPVVSPIDDVPLVPDARLLRNLATVVAEVVADFGTAAFLLSRPGTLPMTESDRRWARALRAAVDPAVSPWPVHLATRDRVQVFAPDDLV